MMFLVTKEMSVYGTNHLSIHSTKIREDNKEFGGKSAFCYLSPHEDIIRAVATIE